MFDAQLLFDEVIKILQNEIAEPLAGIVSDGHSVGIAVYDRVNQPQNVWVFYAATKPRFQDVV